MLRFSQRYFARGTWTLACGTQQRGPLSIKRKNSLFTEFSNYEYVIELLGY
jgi:hypothetical protein